MRIGLAMFLAAAVAMASSCASAEPPKPPPAAPDPHEKITITMERQQWNTIGGVMSQAPASIACLQETQTKAQVTTAIDEPLKMIAAAINPKPGS